MTGWMNITASQLSDATGTPVTNATISWAPVDGNGNPTSFRSGGANGQVIRKPVTATVTNGAFAMQLPDVSQCSPENVGFSVTVTDLETGDIILGPAGYNCVQPSTDVTPPSPSNPRGGAGYGWCNAQGGGNFDQYTPNLPAVPVVTIAGGPTTGVGPSGPPGQPGTPGESATIAINSVVTLAPGAQATVTNSGTASAAELNFGIPQGPQGTPGQPGTPGTPGTPGQPGAAATIGLGTVTTLAPGAQATVTNSGTATAAELNFGIPAGAKGDQGDPGVKGDPGPAPVLSIGSIVFTQSGQTPSGTLTGTAANPDLNLVIPFPAVSIAPTVTLPAGSEATASVSLGANGSIVFTFGIPTGSGSGTGTGTNPGSGTGSGTSSTGLTLVDSDGTDMYVFANNGRLAETPLASQSGAAPPVSNALFVDGGGGYTLMTSVNGHFEWTATSNGTGAVSSITIPDSVTGGTRTLTVTNQRPIVT